MHPPQNDHAHTVLLAEKLLFTFASFNLRLEAVCYFTKKEKSLIPKNMQRPIMLNTHGCNAINVTSIMSKDCRPHKNKSILPSMTYNTRCNSQVSTEEKYSRTDTTVEKWCKFCTSYQELQKLLLLPHWKLTDSWVTIALGAIWIMSIIMLHGALDLQLTGKHYLLELNQCIFSKLTAKRKGYHKQKT